ncbi:MAG: hypothetical protein KBD43_12775 [Saprospiraceae bacterium]|nr:hypothetical protein [Saprospiraceae bacterium]
MNQDILKNLNLSVYKISSEEELKGILDGGLNALYQEVFADPPYNEKFTSTEVEETFRAYFQSGANIFVVLNSSEKPVAFVTSVPLKSDFGVAIVAGSRVDVERTAYFAEDGVVSDLRQKGVSAAMKSILISACRESGFEALLLRTSAYNYRQISAVNKAGGYTLSGLFQQVTSTRSDGKMTQDTRFFYNFDLTESNKQQDLLTLERVTIVRPGGNDTAIVWDDVPRELQGSLSKKIQATYPGIEQVMFVEEGKNGLVRGQMAGGEFCGNATRSLGYLIMDGKDGNATLEVSGANQPMSVQIDNGMAKTSLPVKSSLDSAQPDGDDYIVHLDGISFVITSKANTLGDRVLSETNPDKQKEIVLGALKKNGFATDYPASGVMVIDKQDDDSYKLEPFVYVRDTGTLYYESGCGSGSTSVGVMVAKESGLPVKNLRITQPSGMDLLVSIDREANAFKGATVNGPIEILFDGRMHIAAPKTTKEASVSTPTAQVS